MTEKRITPEDLDTIPLGHRRTIALWLAQRAVDFHESWVLSASDALVIGRALAGAAVDLADPLSEDTTISHALDVLASLSDE